MINCIPNVQDTMKITYQTKNQGNFNLNEKKKADGYQHWNNTDTEIIWKGFQAAVIKMLQLAIMNTLETKEK